VELAAASPGTLDAHLTLAGGEGPFTVALEDASDADLILIAARVAPAAADGPRSS
jgi:hypothetical protein